MAASGVLEEISNPEKLITPLFLSDVALRPCIQCGDCSGICPFGYLMNNPPSRIISNIRANAFQNIIDNDTVWMCISCFACTAICPEKIPVTENLMTRTKEELVLAGNIPLELQKALENSDRYGNPLGESPRKRIDWLKGMESIVPVLGKDIKSVDVLWFVGDYASYHPRVQQVARATARLFHALGVNFGILGVEESSDGDSQRLAGERGLFEKLAEKNQKSMQKYQFKEIVTTDPHALNAIKHQYPSLGINYPVRHFTEFLVERIEQLKPLLKRPLKATVTYHDPCYLGRANNIYDPPRQVLSLVPGVTFVEMPHHHKTSLCCGGGGGGMWLDGFQWEKAHTRTSEWRVLEARSVKADILAVACPYEPPRFEDAVKTIQSAEGLLVKDINEILLDAME